jgi:gas vesicle protein
MRDESKVIAAIVAGLAIGSILGILFAPERGSESRNRIRNAFRRDPVTGEEIDHSLDYLEKGEKHIKPKRTPLEDLKRTSENGHSNVAGAGKKIPGNS